jgi:transcription antitermination factor NusG
MSHINLQWYAVYTRSRSEKKVACELDKSGIDHYLPLYNTLHQWSDRRKKVQLPLISCYVFVHITPNEHYVVDQTSGVVCFVHFNGKPVAIPEWQIKNLQILIGSKMTVEDCRDFKTGSPVRVTMGPLAGLHGIIAEIRGQHKVVICIEALGYNLAVNVDPRMVECANQVIKG